MGFIKSEKGGTLMGDVLNSVIKFDLHIHSKISGYKESNGIVSQSTKENISVLLSKLDENEVALFSITDHNRFDTKLYLEVIKILSEENHPYPNVKGILAGVEFDVKIEDDMKKCHIIAIFDAKNEAGRLQKIEDGLNTKFLKNSSEYYSKLEFENILKEIGLNVILIASQKNNIKNHTGNNNSLSESVKNIEEIIRVGYVDALEFQKPKVEGILLNGLKEFSLPISLFSGSDCHDWSCYPYHDKINQNKEFHHSKAKMLPTFKGLLMAITSPKTRFNCNDKNSSLGIEYIELKGKKYPLAKGINAIIGENGSGKSTLLKLIADKIYETHVKNIINKNELKAVNNTALQNIKYIGQGDIITKFNNDTLFVDGTNSYFNAINNTAFEEEYKKYSDNLKKCIEALIKKEETLINLRNRSISFKKNIVGSNYYINILEDGINESIKNNHKEPCLDIENITLKIWALTTNEYFNCYKAKLDRILIMLSNIHKEIKGNNSSLEYEISVKNIILQTVKDYSSKVNKESSAKDREIKDYEKEKKDIISIVLDAIKTSEENISWPIDPLILEGATRKAKQGFWFNRRANYNETDMKETFFAKIFVGKYNCLEKLKNIKNRSAFTEAIKGCTDSGNINRIWQLNYEKFMNYAINTSDYILGAENKNIGNTLGEMSLAYYKFYTQDSPDWKVLVIDQPEDNISNNNINRNLISYLDEIRDTKQIIFVTHNPLLVVNLDVDNVIHIKNNNGALDISNGCLEYENDEFNILELVAENMDGGRETIEKRLKIYGKNH